MKTKSYKSSHAIDILKNLNDERKSRRRYCDVTLNANFTDFAAHKCILGAFSPFFDTMFNTEMREKYENKANLQGVDKETLEVVLNFLYTCDVTITSENVYKLLETSNYMEIANLKKFCEDFLLDEIDASNCLSIREYSKLYGLKQLCIKAENAIATFFETLITEAEFKELKPTEVLDILQIKEKQISSEEIVFNAIIGWIKHDVNVRQQHLVKLFGLVKLDKLSLEFLQNVVGEKEFIMNSLECTKMCFRSAASRRSLESGLSSSNVRQETQSGQSEPSSSAAVAIQSTEKHFIAFVDKYLLKYNIDTKQTSKLLDIRDCQFLTAVRHNESLYVFLRKDNESLLCMVNIGSMSMKKTLRFPFRIHVHDSLKQCVVVKNHLYIVYAGWKSVFDDERDIACYSICDNTWSELNGLREARNDFSMASSPEGIYVLGGKRPSTDIVLNTVKYLNFQEGEWKNLSSLNEARSECGAVVLNGEVYAIGGKNETGSLRTVERFDSRRNAWRNVAALNVERSNPQACAVNGKIYVAGGDSGVLEVYDPDKDVWEVVAKNSGLLRVACMISP